MKQWKQKQSSEITKKAKKKKNKPDESMELCAALPLLKVILFLVSYPSFSGRLGQSPISGC